MSFQYKATPTSKAFHESDSFVKIMTGPFASGKSTAIAMDILIYALAQAPAPPDPVTGKRIRYSHWGVVRATYPALVSSTRRTLLEVLPQGCGTITKGNAPLSGIFRFSLPDGTEVQLELTLISAAIEQAEEKLRSINWTGCWINEATEVAPEIITYIAGRVGRYPGSQLGGCSYAGLLMDFNQPAQGSFLKKLMESSSLEVDGRILTVETFRQPPAAFRVEDENGRVTYEVNPEAENLENLHGGVSYYQNQIAMHLMNERPDLVESLFCMLDVMVKAGKAVFPKFSRELHMAKVVVDPQPRTKTIVGYDTSGIHPAVVIIQQHQGKWLVLDELIGVDLGLEAFVEEALVPLLRGRYPNCDFIVSADPANAKDSYTGLSPAVHLKKFGFQVHLPKTNDPKTRIRAVEILLNKQGGGLMISPNCQNLIRALGGAYHYRKLRLSGSVDNIYGTRPDKNDASHIADALQYAALYINRGETPANDYHQRSLAGRRAGQMNRMKGRILI
jgi:hypothetical protein